MLILYYKPTCPYCQRVLGELEDLGLKANLKDISSDEAIVNELLEKGGKSQVPFLVDEEREVALYESGDIIDYIRENYSQTANGSDSFNGLKIHNSDESCSSCQ